MMHLIDRPGGRAYKVWVPKNPKCHPRGMRIIHGPFTWNHEISDKGAFFSKTIAGGAFS